MAAQDKDSGSGNRGERDTTFTNYAEFWPYYLQQHSRIGTRRAHFTGTALVLVIAALTALTGIWLLLIALPLVGYGFAWAGHFFIEKNRPATFRHPIWSLYSDFRMFFLWCRGRLERERMNVGLSD